MTYYSPHKIKRNGGHIKPPLHHDYVVLKKKHGAEQAAKLVRLRLMHLREMLAVATEEDILDKCNCREVDSLDVHFTSEMFDEAKEHLETWRKDMPEESKNNFWFEGKDAIEVILNSSSSSHYSLTSFLFGDYLFTLTEISLVF